MKQALSTYLLLVLSACGGKAVFEAGAGGAAGSSTSSSADTGTSTGSTSTATSTSTGGGPCSSHDDCPGGLCLFATGQCAPACQPASCDACGAGSFCEPCATSSCPKCDDCRAACVPAAPGRCDDDDPCPAGSTCLWTQGVCAPLCGPNGDCGDFFFCDGCASSSCCGCRNCVGACIGGE